MPRLSESHGTGFHVFLDSWGTLLSLLLVSSALRFSATLSSLKNTHTWCSDWTVQSLFVKLGNLVEVDPKRQWCEACDYWPKGGAIAINWKSWLWARVAHEPYGRQKWHLYTLMRLLMPNEFLILIFDLWPLAQPPFWILWKTLKIYLVPGSLSKMHENFYTWTLDRYKQKIRSTFNFGENLKFLWANENCWFVKLLLLLLIHCFCEQFVQNVLHTIYGPLFDIPCLTELCKWMAYTL